MRDAALSQLAEIRLLQARLKAAEHAAEIRRLERAVAGGGDGLSANGNHDHAASTGEPSAGDAQGASGERLGLQYRWAAILGSLEHCATLIITWWFVCSPCDMSSIQIHRVCLFS